MELGPAIIARLEADPAVTAIVGQRINWLVRPQGKSGDLPCLVLQEITGTRDQHLKGWQDMREATVQVGCLSLRYSESRLLAEAVIDCLVPVADVENPDGDNLVFWRGSTTGPHDLGNQEETRFVHRAVVDLTLRYGTAPPPPPLAVMDFKAGTYAINGEASSLTAMLVEGDGFQYSQIEPGVGWHNAGPTGQQGGYALASPALRTAIENGVTVLMEWRYSEASQWVDVGINGSDQNTARTENVVSNVTIGYSPETPVGCGIGNTAFGPPIQHEFLYDYDSVPAELDMLHRFAGTLIDTQADASHDGGPTVSLTTLVPGNGALPGELWLMGFGGGGGAVSAGPSDMVVERAIFYPPKAPGDLPALTAPAEGVRKATTTRRVSGPRPGVERRTGPRPRRS